MYKFFEHCSYDPYQILARPIYYLLAVKYKFKPWLHLPYRLYRTDFFITVRGVEVCYLHKKDAFQANLREIVDTLPDADEDVMSINERIQLLTRQPNDTHLSYEERIENTLEMLRNL